MKIVVQLAPDQVEKVLSGLDDEHFTVDPEAFCHFRDEVFIKGIENFIKETAPKKWKEMGSRDTAERVGLWYQNQSLIQRYYKRYKKRQPTFHQYKNGIYFYQFTGFANVGNEIQLMKLETEDTIEFLNRPHKGIFERLFNTMRT